MVKMLNRSKMWKPGGALATEASVTNAGSALRGVPHLGRSYFTSLGLSPTQHLGKQSPQILQAAQPASTASEGFNLINNQQHQ